MVAAAVVAVTGTEMEIPHMAEATLTPMDIQMVDLMDTLEAVEVVTEVAEAAEVVAEMSTATLEEAVAVTEEVVDMAVVVLVETA